MSKPTTPARPGPAGEIHERLQRYLERLGLKGLDIEAHLAWVKEKKPSELEAVERLLAQAAALQRERSIEWRIKGSGLKVRKTMAAFDWAFQPKLERRTIEELFTLAFVQRHEDVLITGKAGTGKSHILKALVIKGCEQEWMVRYARCVDLIDDLYAGLADGSYERRMKRWCRPAFLVIDDVGLGQLKRRDEEPTAAHMLFTLLDRRHTNATTGITSNIKLSAWGKYLGDATLAAAVLDRLAANSIRIDRRGVAVRVAHRRAVAGASPQAARLVRADDPLPRASQERVTRPRSLPTSAGRQLFPKWK
jgi:DNA replication protein DnaC